MLGKNIPKDITKFKVWIKNILQNNKHKWINDSVKQNVEWDQNNIETIEDAVKRNVVKFPKHDIYTQCFCNTCNTNDAKDIDWMKKCYCITCSKKFKKNVTFIHALKNKELYCEYGHKLVVERSFPWYFPNIHLKKLPQLKLPKNNNFVCNCVTCFTNDKHRVSLNTIEYCKECGESSICHKLKDTIGFCYKHNKIKCSEKYHHVWFI